MFLVRRIIDLPAVFFRSEEVCFGKLVEFFSDRVRRNIEVLRKLPQVRSGLRVKEESAQQFDPGF